VSVFLKNMVVSRGVAAVKIEGAYVAVGHYRPLPAFIGLCRGRRILACLSTPSLGLCACHIATLSRTWSCPGGSRVLFFLGGGKFSSEKGGRSRGLFTHFCDRTI
jgi:hypothetical protein